MSTEIKVPSPGESITQVQLAKWLVAEGDIMEKDQEIAEIDSDKASFTVTAPVKGKIFLKVNEGDTVAVGAVIAIIEKVSEEASTITSTSHTDIKKEATLATPTHQPLESKPPQMRMTPLASKIIKEQMINAPEITTAFPGKKITRKDIEQFIRARNPQAPFPFPSGSRTEDRKKMTALRLKLAERLVTVRNQTAMLTTFNEINMSAILKIKEEHGEGFKEKYGVSIGFMSFFTRAVVLALQEYPQVNSMIDGDELVIPHYIDVGIAVSAPKGLVVPVIRNAELLGVPEIEVKIKELALLARENKLTIDDMKGGTFTISNGGVFGSLLSTPILNPPQSAILGMHKIEERPVALDGQVVIAPMMYVALSYDHRVIDGRESVGFLVKVKEILEYPLRMITGGEDPATIILDL
jgi:2-oxoglutarate dehydrogenase E2 component (dihydrolipoamide succinyltransferase)